MLYVVVHYYYYYYYYYEWIGRFHIPQMRTLFTIRFEPNHHFIVDWYWERRTSQRLPTWKSLWSFGNMKTLPNIKYLDKIDVLWLLHIYYMIQYKKFLLKFLTDEKKKNNMKKNPDHPRRFNIYFSPLLTYLWFDLWDAEIIIFRN